MRCMFMSVVLDLFMHMYVHVESVTKTRHCKATTPEDNSFFPKKKRTASGGTQTHGILHTVQMLYQLSHQGSPAGQAESFKRCLSPGNSNSVLRGMYMYMYVVPQLLVPPNVQETYSSGLQWYTHKEKLVNAQRHSVSQGTPTHHHIESSHNTE